MSHILQVVMTFGRTRSFLEGVVDRPPTEAHHEWLQCCHRAVHRKSSPLHVPRPRTQDGLAACTKRLISGHHGSSTTRRSYMNSAPGFQARAWKAVQAGRLPLHSLAAASTLREAACATLASVVAGRLMRQPGMQLERLRRSQPNRCSSPARSGEATLRALLPRSRRPMRTSMGPELARQGLRAHRGQKHRQQQTSAQTLSSGSRHQRRCR